MANAESAGSGSSLDDLGSIVDIGKGLFGTGASGKGTTSGTTSVKSEEQLILEREAIAKIIEDVLGGAQGLGSIFGEEQVAGIFDSSVAAQAAGDITSKLVGELARLTGRKTTTSETKADQTTKQESGEEGLIETIGGFLGF